MNSLKSQSAFSRVYREGERFAGKWMKICVVRSSRQESRIGIVCGKETSRKSVDRNRIKRRLRECCRLHEEEMGMGIEMVIIAKKEMGQQPTPHFKEITADFLALCEKADALKK